MMFVGVPAGTVGAACANGTAADVSTMPTAIARAVRVGLIVDYQRIPIEANEGTFGPLLVKDPDVDTVEVDVPSRLLPPASAGAPSPMRPVAMTAIASAARLPIFFDRICFPFVFGGQPTRPPDDIQ